MIGLQTYQRQAFDSGNKGFHLGFRFGIMAANVL